MKAHIIKSGIKLSPQQIDGLIADESDLVRMTLAKSNHPLTPQQSFTISLDSNADVSNALFQSERGYRDAEMCFFKNHLNDKIREKAQHHDSYQIFNDTKNIPEVRAAYRHLLKNGSPEECMHLILNKHIFQITFEMLAEVYNNPNPLVRTLGIKQNVPITRKHIAQCVRDKEFMVRRALCGSRIPLTDPQIFQLVSSDNDEATLSKEILRSGRPLSPKVLNMFRKHPNNEVVLMALLKKRIN